MKLVAPRSSSLLAGLAAVVALASPFSSARAQTTPPSSGRSAAAPLPQGVRAFESAPINSMSWYGRFGLTNCSWIDLGEGVMVIDTGASAADAQNLIAEIKRTTNGKPVRWIVMTHNHQDSNNGLTSFLPTDATIFVHEKSSAHVAAAVAKKGMKMPTVIGIGSKVFVASGIHGVEIGVMPGHTDHDIYAYSNEIGAMFIGDIITPGTPALGATATSPEIRGTPGRCPMMSDPTVDPNAWLVALDTIAAHNPAVIIPTRGNASELVGPDIAITRKYIERILEATIKAKKANYPDSRVSGELFMQRLGEYCPSQLDSLNALTVYHRISADGTVHGAATPKNVPVVKKAAPAAKKK
ncbi:MAG: MBL fold metallo-hydrolase [Thermoanaerobaculia bacterium]